jgi:hypothetical protein
MDPQRDGRINQRRGFRGTAENAKTKICMRYVIRCTCAAMRWGECPGWFVLGIFVCPVWSKDYALRAWLCPGGNRRSDVSHGRSCLLRITDRWQNGECRFGDRCNFAHGDDELRQLPPRHEGGPPGGRGRGRGHYHGDEGYGGGRGRGGGGHGGGGHGGGGHGGGHGAAHPGGGYGREAQHGHGNHSQEHQAWVQSGCPVAGPNGWTQYSTPSGEKYYHNSNTDETQWDVPAEWREPQQ